VAAAAAAAAATTTLPKCTNTYFEFGWKEQIQTVQKPAFSGVPGINKNFHITQDSSP
jgi:hypothetical protein